MSGQLFFISDTHFGHRKIIQFEHEARPFDTIEEHDEQLIQNWNSVVRDRDTVWHLGDVLFGTRSFELIHRLKGHKKLVMGNHDMYPTSRYLEVFDRLAGVLEIDGNICTHVPVHENQFGRYRYNIHGHLHSKTVKRYANVETGIGFMTEQQDDTRYINVACEHIGLTPIAYEDLKKRMT